MRACLLVQRVNEPGQGLWTIPAGFVDAREDPARAAERECLEETGLVVVVDQLLGVVAGREHPNGADMVLAYRALIYWVNRWLAMMPAMPPFFHAPPCPRWPSAPRASCSASKNMTYFLDGCQVIFIPNTNAKAGPDCQPLR